MKRQIIEELAVELRNKKSSLLQDSIHAEFEATEERESELEESAQKDRIARLTSRLKERDQKTIRDIDAALERMASGEYGLCENCGNEIAVGRLRALPMADLCIDCATAKEKSKQAGIVEEPVESSSALSSD